MAWYYSVDDPSRVRDRDEPPFGRSFGELRQRPAKDLDKDCIFRHFSQPHIGHQCPVLCYFVNTASPGSEVDGLDVTFMDRNGLREFLFPTGAKAHTVPRFGILQRFIPPKGPSCEALQACWAPQVFFVIRRVNRHKLPKRPGAPSSYRRRAVTFDGPSALSEEHRTSGRTARKVKQCCDELADGLLHDNERKGAFITRLVAYFRRDLNERLWLLHTGSVRVADRDVRQEPARVDPVSLCFLTSPTRRGLQHGEGGGGGCATGGSALQAARARRRRPRSASPDGERSIRDASATKRAQLSKACRRLARELQWLRCSARPSSPGQLPASRNGPLLTPSPLDIDAPTSPPAEWAAPVQPLPPARPRLKERRKAQLPSAARAVRRRRAQRCSQPVQLAGHTDRASMRRRTIESGPAQCTVPLWDRAVRPSVSVVVAVATAQLYAAADAIDDQLYHLRSDLAAAVSTIGGESGGSAGRRYVRPPCLSVHVAAQHQWALAARPGFCGFGSVLRGLGLEEDGDEWLFPAAVARRQYPLARMEQPCRPIAVAAAAAEEAALLELWRQRQQLYTYQQMLRQIEAAVPSEMLRTTTPPRSPPVWVRTLVCSSFTAAALLAHSAPPAEAAGRGTQALRNALYYTTEELRLALPAARRRSTVAAVAARRAAAAARRRTACGGDGRPTALAQICAAGDGASLQLVVAASAAANAGVDAAPAVADAAADVADAAADVAAEEASAAAPAPTPLAPATAGFADSAAESDAEEAPPTQAVAAPSLQSVSPQAVSPQAVVGSPEAPQSAPNEPPAVDLFAAAHAADAAGACCVALLVAAAVLQTPDRGWIAALRLRLHSGSGLLSMVSRSGSNCQVCVLLSGVEVGRSEVAERTRNPVWGGELLVEPRPRPALADCPVLRLQALHKSKWTEDEDFLGCHDVVLQESSAHMQRTTLPLGPRPGVPEDLRLDRRGDGLGSIDVEWQVDEGGPF
eukprot:TRINITY_DN11812_c0_g1_i1.p1 TRINITY_DN11812_c0_g1~~TRINITY_DN11812_c0_g1_i1.p1  ORF type:complete len:1034 (+),score=241.73 TRINITY_DN11812_c0_g1_i1:182-3103(+)